METTVHLGVLASTAGVIVTAVNPTGSVVTLVCAYPDVREASKNTTEERNPRARGFIEAFILASSGSDTSSFRDRRSTFFRFHWRSCRGGNSCRSPLGAVKGGVSQGNGSKALPPGSAAVPAAGFGVPPKQAFPSVPSLQAGDWKFAWAGRPCQHSGRVRYRCVSHHL